MNSRDSSVPQDSSEVALEQQIQAAGLTAPRITSAHVDEQITHVAYFTAAQGYHQAQEDDGLDSDDISLPGSLCLLTICVLTLQNGFVVTGESACASPENFNEKIGQDIAYRNARDKIWALEGYQLRTQLAEAQRARLHTLVGGL